MHNVQYKSVIMITQNILTFSKRQNYSFTSSAIRHFSRSRHLHNGNAPTIPVKLAYASYESTNEAEKSAKQPIMIMHGLFGSKNNWNSLSKAIHQKTTRKVIIVDARNHGDSPHSPEMTYKHMAQDVVQLLNDLGLKKVTLVGHSMGGSAMMYTALSFPELVEKLVVIDMSPVGTSPSLLEMTKIFQAMRSINLDGSTSLTKARRLAEEQLASAIKSHALRQFLTMNLVEAESGKYKWRVNLPVLEQNFPSQIAVFPPVGSKVFAGPTLFIGGSKSDYIRVKDHPSIKKLFPSAKFHYIDGANHWVHADKPTEFLKVLTEFINETHS